MTEKHMEVIGPIRGADIVPPSALEQAREFARRSKAENTLRGYRADWNHFCSWCEARHLHPLPASADAVASYIADCAGRLKVGTIQRRLNAIAEAHKAMGLESSHASRDGCEHHEGHPADEGHGPNTKGTHFDGRHPGHGGRYGRGFDRST